MMVVAGLHGFEVEFGFRVSFVVACVVISDLPCEFGVGDGYEDSRIRFGLVGY